MIPKFNKDLQRWGVWTAFGEFMLDLNTGEPLRFQSKQEAQRYINEISL